jgi:CheY-like chemotaxis protein
MAKTNQTDRILVADDDPANLKVILDLLSDSTVEVLYAKDGKRAYELAEAELPDAIIMDWEMPIMNGLEAISRIQSNPLLTQIPIIVATGVMIESLDLKAAMESGAVDFLRKPFDPIEFRARLQSALKLSKAFKEVKFLAEKEKALIQEALEKKERELSTSAISDFQKNGLLSKLLEQLKRLDTVTNNMHAPDIKNISREIKSYIDLDKSWVNFKKHFEEVHPEFFESLSSSFPDLSSNEQRICSYLRIGLSNKEMATLTNIESASVRRALTRIKKKMNLGPDDVLREAIEHL